MYLTRGGSVQRPLTSGPKGWPTGQVYVGLARGFIHVSTREGEDQGGGESLWRPNQMAGQPRG
jgi:hypothetical protein